MHVLGELGQVGDRDGQGCGYAEQIGPVLPLVGRGFGR